LFAKIENGVTKISPEKQKNAFSILIFGLKLPFLEQDGNRLLFVRVEIGVTEFSTKSPKKKKQWPAFFEQKPNRNTCFQRGIYIFWPWKNKLWGYNFKTG
tara:strand:- start:686 stop:985 length:300 start_codon:yes stop_codon:yes gene_type:complete